MTFLVTLFAFGLAGYATLRMRPKNPVAAVLTLIGYVLTFLVILTLLKTVLPRFFVSALPGFQSNWQPVWREASGVGNQAVTAVNGWLDLGVPELTVVDGPAAPAPAPEAALPPPDAASQVAAETAPDTGATAVLSPTAVFTQPVTAPARLRRTAPPRPTLTETRKLPLYNALAAARNQNDRLTAETAVAQLLELDPLDAVALETQLQMQAADQRLAAYAALGDLPPQLGKRSDWQQQVRETLRSGRYHVTDNGAVLTNLACQERATLLDETPGFTYGTAFTVPRCYLEPFEATKTGARFAVP